MTKSLRSTFYAAPSTANFLNSTLISLLPSKHQRHAQVAHAQAGAGDDAVVERMQYGRCVVAFERVEQIVARFFCPRKRRSVNDGPGQNRDVLTPVNKLMARPVGAV